MTPPSTSWCSPRTARTRPHRIGGIAATRGNAPTWTQPSCRCAKSCRWARARLAAVSARLIEVELRVRDVARSARFYRELIGVSVGGGETHGDDTEPPGAAPLGEGAPGEPPLVILKIYPASGAIT